MTSLRGRGGRAIAPHAVHSRQPEDALTAASVPSTKCPEQRHACAAQNSQRYSSISPHSRTINHPLATHRLSSSVTTSGSSLCCHQIQGTRRSTRHLLHDHLCMALLVEHLLSNGRLSR